ncbi:hypothetical protein SteCoe_28146 [Stentor coeruleus]|uniref:Uncharacterized protein n=1 Tax=Stentor coeruleus TaxID=5963 RepID=A0A1R2B8U2_9CILI|nr:hypothetical protein SteCoe_28146 [Stentor coeruleus]
MSYVIDIENPQIKWAMDYLGISSNELEKKTLNDFSNGLSREIQYIKFQYYMRNIDKTVKLIEEILANSNNYESTTEIGQKKIQVAEEPKLQKKTLVNGKDKNLVIHAIESASFESRSLSPFISRKTQEQVQKFKIFQQKQKENLMKIHTNEEHIRNKSLSPIEKYESFRKIQFTVKKQGKSFDFYTQDHTSSENPHKDQGTIIDSGIGLHEYDDEIDEKLEKLQEKFNKSTMIRQNTIEKKKDLAKTPERIRKAIEDSDGQYQTLQKIIERENSLKQWKVKQLQEKKKAQSIRKIKENKANKFIQMSTDYMKQIKAKAEALKVKDMKFESNYLNQKKIFFKEIAIKSELHKLKDEQASINAKRMQKLDSYKKQAILEKHITQKEKFEKTKLTKEKQNTKTRENSIINMINREKVNNSILMIQKSPLSKNSQILLKALEIDTSQNHLCSHIIQSSKSRSKSSISSPINSLY